MRKKLTAWTSAFRAGLIQARCTTGCIADDATETIYPCAQHQEEIARLAAINDQANR